MGTRRGRRSVAWTAGVLGAAAVAAFGYAVAWEPKRWTLRRFDVPVLRPDAEPFRVLHVSDLHMLTGHRSKQAWVRGLAALDPDLVILTGDFIAAADAIESVIHTLEPLADRPGAFVLGNSDYHASLPKGPWNYVPKWRRETLGDQMPTQELTTALTKLNWVDLTNRRTIITAGGRQVELSGVDDPSLSRDDYGTVAGPVREDSEIRLGLLHAPEPDLISRFALDGFDVMLAGHTHGGQVRVPGYGAVVTNCGIDRRRSRGLHRWQDHSWLHVSAGLGQSPYAPIRFNCLPEASLLTLIPNPQLR